MAYHKAQSLANTPLSAGGGNYNAQSQTSTPRRTGCPYEEHVVTDPNASRIMLMILRDFVCREAVYDRVQDGQTKFDCPIIKCYAAFDQPMDLIAHLLECKQLRFGEFSCSKCRDWHRYPITEREWQEWEGWPTEPAPTTSFKKKISDIFSDSFGRGLRSPKRRNGSSSYGGSPCSITTNLGPPGWLGSESNLPAEHGKANLGSPDFFGPAYESPDQIGPVCGSIGLGTSTGQQTFLHAFGTHEFHASELTDTSPPSYHDGYLECPLSDQSISSSRSSSHSRMDFSGMPGSLWYSPATSLDSLQSTAPQLQAPSQQSATQYLPHLTQSPDGMRDAPFAGQEAWLPTSAPAHRSNAVSGIVTISPANNSQESAAGYIPLGSMHASLVDYRLGGQNPIDNASAGIPPQELPSNLVGVGRDGRVMGFGAVDCFRRAELPVCEPAIELQAFDSPVELGDCQLSPEAVFSKHSRFGQASNYTCEKCSWRPQDNGKPENFANYLRKHKQTHLGRKFYCQHDGCERSYSRPDNLGKHVKECHRAALD